jgi:hypothetical protein
MLKPLNESLTDILQIMVSHNKIDLSVQTVEYLCPFGSSAQAKIAQVKNCIIFIYHAIPICYQCLIHLRHVLERTIAKTNDVRMIEVRI